MGESPRHLFLKNIGRAFLYNQGCYLVDTEVKLNHLGLKRYEGLDSHTVIDVCGVGLKYFRPGKKQLQRGDYDDFELGSRRGYELGNNILRGVEAKVSRSDFRNGFVCSGCNYHYILAPMRLVAQYEVPRWVGLLEFNKHKFSCELNEEFETSATRPFRLSGLRVVRRPVFRSVPQFQIDHAIATIAERTKREDLTRIFHGILEDWEDARLAC